MVGRGTRIHEETQKYKFWLYDYTGVTDLFGTDFITPAAAPRWRWQGGGGDDGGGGGEGGESPAVRRDRRADRLITPQGRFILSRRDGRDMPIPVDEYRREMIQRVLARGAQPRRVPRSCGSKPRSAAGSSTICWATTSAPSSSARSTR